MVGVSRGREFEGVKVGNGVFKELSLCLKKINFANQQYCTEDSYY